MKYRFKWYVTKSVKVRQLEGKDGVCYWVRQPIEWIDENGNRWCTPADIVSDGLSIPRPAWGLLKWLFSLKDGFVHDPAYWLQPYSKRISDYNIWAGILSQREGRRWYRKRMLEFVANLVWTGLKIGGWKAWNKYKRILNEVGYERVLEMHTAHTIEEAMIIAQKWFK